MTTGSPTDRWRRRLCAAAPPVLLALAPFGYYWRATLGRVALLESDGIAYHFPLRLLAARYVQQGYWPLWNPSVFSGFPFLGAMQPALLYPATWLFLCLPPIAAMNLQVLTSFSVAALAMYAYARSIGCGRYPASFAAFTFANSGFVLRGIGHLVLLQGLCWLPLLLWSLERLRQQTRVRFVLIGAAALACIVFAGHPQVPSYILFLALAYIAFFSWRAPVGAMRFITWTGLTVTSGILFTAVQLVPTVELGAQSVRASLTYDAFVSYSVPLRQLPLVVMPFLLDGWSGNAYWSVGTMFIALTGYVGIAALVLALAVSRRARIDPHVGFWSIVAVGALLLALGGSIPLAQLTYHVPVYNTFRAHGRMLLVFDSALAVLSGLALQRIPMRALVPAAALVAATVAALTIVALTAGPRIWGGLATSELTGEALRGLLDRSFTLRNPGLTLPLLLSAAVISVGLLARRAPRLAALALFVTQIADLWLFGAWLAPQFPPADTIVAEPLDVRTVRAIESVPFDFRTASSSPFSHRPDWQTPTINGYDPLMIARYAELAGGMTYPGVISLAALQQTPGFLDLLNAKYLVFGLLPPETLDPVIDGVGFSPLLLNETLTAGAGLELVVPSPGPVTHIAAVTAMANSVAVTDDTAVARFTVWDADGQAEQVLLRAGADTAEWAWERPDVAPIVRHRQARVADSGSVGGWNAHRYFAKLALPRRLAVARMRVEALVPGVGVMVGRLTLYDAETTHSVPITAEYALLANHERWTVRYATDRFAVAENQHVLPRAWLVPASQRLPPEAILATIRSGSLPDGRRFDPRALALVEDVPGRDYAPPDPAAAADVVRYEPNAIELATRSAGPALLVLSEVFYPGWFAFVDDAPTPILRTDYALRGIELPAGAHRVRVVYAPTSVKLGLSISLITAGALAVFGVSSSLRRRRSRVAAGQPQARAAPS